MPNEVRKTSISSLVSITNCSDCKAGYTGELLYGMGGMEGGRGASLKFNVTFVISDIAPNDE